MSNELVAKEQNHAAYIDKNITLIANQNKLSDEALQNFIIQCKRTGLDPITRQIYAIPQAGKLTIMASIDGLRLIAERTGKYQGQTKPEWCGKDGKWVDVWLDNGEPAAARIGVWKENFREPTYGVAKFSEFCKPSSPTWKSMPTHMLSKVAESLALRKAFPNEMSGIYTPEEMDQAAHDQPKDVTPQQSQEAKTYTPRSETIVELGEYVVQFGKKLAGQKLKNIDPVQLESYIFDYLEQGAKKNNKPLEGGALELFNKGSAYLKLFVNHDTPPPKLDNEDQVPF